MRARVVLRCEGCQDTAKHGECAPAVGDRDDKSEEFVVVIAMDGYTHKCRRFYRKPAEAIASAGLCEISIT